MRLSQSLIYFLWLFWKFWSPVKIAGDRYKKFIYGDKSFIMCSKCAEFYEDSIEKIKNLFSLIPHIFFVSFLKIYDKSKNTYWFIKSLFEKIEDHLCAQIVQNVMRIPWKKTKDRLSQFIIYLWWIFWKIQSLDTCRICGRSLPKVYL